MLARKALVSKGGWIDRYFSIAGKSQEKIVKQAYADTSLRTYMNLKKELDAREVDDQSPLLEYPYRDDGLLIWQAIETYVRDFVRIFCHCDEDVASDCLLENWIPEFERIGYKRSDWGYIRTQAGLEEFLTAVLFTATFDLAVFG